MSGYFEKLIPEGIIYIPKSFFGKFNSIKLVLKCISQNSVLKIHFKNHFENLISKIFKIFENLFWEIFETCSKVTIMYNKMIKFGGANKEIMGVQK